MNQVTIDKLITEHSEWTPQGYAIVDSHRLKFAAALLSASNAAVSQTDDGETTREVIQPLKEPVTISKALLAGRIAKVGGNEKETTAFLVNIQIAPWGAPKDWVEGFVDGFNRAAKWMQGALTEFHATPVEEPSTNALNALKRARDGWQDEAAALARRLKLSEADNDLLRAHQAKDAWYFQGDGEDHIESMGSNMVVVIHAHDLRSLMASAPAQCGCQISHAEFNPDGELKRVTIHYGENRVAYIKLPAQSDDALTRELLDTLQATVKHFTKAPSTLADSTVRGTAHEVIAKAYAQLGYREPDPVTPAQPDEPCEHCKTNRPYHDLDCPVAAKVLGKVLGARSVVSQPKVSCPRCELPLEQGCNCDAAYAARAEAQVERALTEVELKRAADASCFCRTADGGWIFSRTDQLRTFLATTQLANGGEHG